MVWTAPIFSVQQVNAAGRILVASQTDDQEWWDANFADYLNALDVINNWRGSHAYPLNTFQINLRSTAKRFDPRPLVAQRVKRMISISNKLQLQKSMKLSQMQDLGGCRAILASVATVREVVNYYHKKSSIKHTLASSDDYIDAPKKSGYRGMHLVYRYHSDKNKDIYNGLKIEMQIRSRYQHAWATAVETVSMFSGQALKSSLGSDEWKRFFSLMGSVIALREGSPLVPDTPSNKSDLISELLEVSTLLQVEHRLSEYNKALHSITSGTQDAYFYLMKLDPASRTLSVQGFSEKEALEANAKYAEAEAEAKSNPGTDAVLVSVESVGSLAKAYPNYFADTRLFVELLRQALAGRTRSIRVPDLKIGQMNFFFKESIS